MKELTKEQRHSIYVKALEHYKKHLTENLIFGLCDAVEYGALKTLGFDYPDPYGSMVPYPEIYKYQPLESDGYWFDRWGEGITKRIEILEEAIKLTE